MKSHILRFYNYTDIPFEEVTEIIEKEDMESELSTDIKTVLLSHKIYTEVTKIEKGDVTTLSLKSELPRFNKESIDVSIGMGLFSKELEADIIGHSAGDSFTVTLQEKPVEVTVKSCKRLTVPELNDKFVKTLDIEGVTTVADYKKHLAKNKIDFFRDAYVEMYAAQLLSDACDQSELEIDEDEKESFYHRWVQREKEYNEFHNVTVLENYEGEAEIIHREDSFNFMKTCMAYCFFSGIDHKNFNVDFNDTETVNKISKTALAPLERYLSSKVHIVYEEEK